MSIKKELVPPLVIFLLLLTGICSVWFSGHVLVKETWTEKALGYPRSRVDVVRQSSGLNVTEVRSSFIPNPFEQGYDRQKDIIPFGIETRHSGFGPAGPRGHGHIDIMPKVNYHYSIKWR